MPRIDINHPSQFIKPEEWTKAKYQEILKHPTWQGILSLKECEEKLKNHPPFTYLLHQQEENQLYFISFVQKDHTIKQQYFTLAYERKGWFYRNGVTDGKAEIVEPTLDQLIPEMMHCQAQECRPLLPG